MTMLHKRDKVLPVKYNDKGSDINVKICRYNRKRIFN